MGELSDKNDCDPSGGFVVPPEFADLLTAMPTIHNGNASYFKPINLQDESYIDRAWEDLGHKRKAALLRRVENRWSHKHASR